MGLLSIWLAFGVLSAMVAKEKNRSKLNWFSIGVLFGPFGLIASIIVSKIDPLAVKPEEPKFSEVWAEASGFGKFAVFFFYSCMALCAFIIFAI